MANELYLKNLVNQLQMQIRDLNRRVTALEQAVTRLRGMRVEVRRDFNENEGANILRTHVVNNSHLPRGNPFAVPFNFEMGYKGLVILVNGKELIPEIDYKELDNQHVSFTFDLPAGVYLTFIKVQ